MTTSTDWFAPLEVHAEPLLDSRLESGDWAQDNCFEQPLWDNTAADIARRVSIANVDGLYGLLINASEEQFDAFLRVGGWLQLRTYRVAIVESANPIHDGFLRRVQLVHDDIPQPVAPEQLLHAFLLAEHARIGNMEKWLRGRYGEHPSDDVEFEWIDYPAFDNGHVSLGYVLFNYGHELHCWTRADFWPK